MIKQFKNECRGLVTTIRQTNSLILGTKTPLEESLIDNARFRIQAIYGDAHVHGPSPQADSVAEVFAHLENGTTFCFKIPLEEFKKMTGLVLKDQGWDDIDPM